ncbi:MAG: 50S ribosomal protein L18 [Mycoplasmoidaceae bacterium]|nr:MAG: 50S ribosomal protein L18 [Mycoplasmoidaceae bacterium]
MKTINIDRKYKKNLRRARLLKRLKREGNEKPRLIVSKSNSNLFVQVFNDQDSKVIASISSIQLKKPANMVIAKQLGTKIAEKAIAAGVKEVTFDRSGNKYHGQVKAVADAAREKGLVF